MDKCMSGAGISKYLSNPQLFEIESVATITSTNSVLKERALSGAPQGSVLIAGEQTMGRGRMGRRFYSPSDTGVYMSILLRPDMDASDSLFITTAAAVAVAKAIETVADLDAQIKWVNDIYCNGKKVCGILTESSINVETGRLDWAVLGIGINIMRPKQGFPDDIKEIADAILDYDSHDGQQIRSRLVANVINYFWDFYEKIEQRTFMEEYIRRSCVVGKKIFILEKGKKTEANAIGIDENAGLVVQMQDGTIETISSGEISIRMALP